MLDPFARVRTVATSRTVATLLALVLALLGALGPLGPLGMARPAAAASPPPASAEPEPEPPAAPPKPTLAGGFSLERGAWLATGRAEFGLGLLATTRYGATITDAGVGSLGFTLPFVRPNLHASLFDDKLRVFVMPELAPPSPRLLDAQVIWQPHPAFGLDLGQYRPHLARAWNTPMPLIALPGRGTVDEFFTSDRALGATVFGRPLAGKLEYDLGLLNAGGFNLAQPARLDPLLTWRLAYNPLGALPLTQTPAFADVDRTLVGLAVHGWTDRQTPAQDDPLIKPIDRRRVTAGGELVLMTPRVHLLVEGFARWELDDSGLLDAGWGSQAQVEVMLLSDALGLQTRGGVIDRGLGEPTQGVWEGGLSWYLRGNHLRAQLHYLCVQSFSDPVGCERHRAQLQTQLWF